MHVCLRSFRTNIGNARLAGLEEDLGMKGLQYNVSELLHRSFSAVDPCFERQLTVDSTLSPSSSHSTLSSRSHRT